MKTKKYALAGCCGMSCALCPRFHSQSSSKCPGCGLSSNRKCCSTFKCCNQKHHYETCAECAVFPCERLFLQDDWAGFNTRKKWFDNINHIKEIGIEQWFNEQIEKEAMLKEALKYFNNGRMRSFFCLSFLYFDLETIKKLLAAAHSLKSFDPKKRSQLFQTAVKAEAARHNLKVWEE